MTTTIEMATRGYKERAREQETKKIPGKPALSSIKLRLPSDYGELLDSPPTRAEARFLSKDMQTLFQDLEFADKGLQAIPNIEGKIRRINGEMYRAMADQNRDKYDNLKLSLRNEEQSLADIQAKVDSTLRAANAFHKNNPNDIGRAKSTLKTLRTEHSAPYTYSDAQDNLPTHTKTTLNWIQDLETNGSMDDRLLARQVLETGGVDAKSLLTEAERQGLSLTEKAVAEMRDAGATRGQQTSVGSERPSSQGSNSGSESQGGDGMA